MIVPRFWAEARLQQRHGDQQITIRRFGWSDESDAAAQSLADERARLAMQRTLAGETLARREPKIPYNGAEGVPIREEILARHGDVVITRNSYGARCLNTPNVLFVDIDFQEGPRASSTFGIVLLLLLAAIVIGWRLHSMPIGIALFFAAALLGGKLSALLFRSRLPESGPEGAARARIDRFIAKHPDWSLRLYRTPAGIRALAMHRTFAPNDPSVKECFDALGADPLYALMCRNQQCFRARLGPKPWRIGVQTHMRPRPGVWPVAPERRAMRDQWIEKYEAAANGFAACSYLESVGSNVLNPSARQVQELHDTLCKANAKIPIA